LDYRTVKKTDDMLSCFHLIPERNGRTDRLAISLSRVSMLTRDKNKIKQYQHKEKTQWKRNSEPRKNYLYKT